MLILLRAGVSSTLRWIHNRLNATRGLNTNIPYEASVFECMQRPLQFLSLFTVGTALAEAVSRPLSATALLPHIITLRELAIIFSATWFLLRWIDRIRARFSADKRIDNAQVGATARIATVATFVVSLLISLDTIGINVQTVLAFGGIGGVAIGFAGREIISNFFGGFMIYVTRPFSVGEWIRSIEESQLNGTVEDIGWYLTRVRTWDKRPLYIPNSRFSTLIVENGSRMDNRRILHTLHLRHEDVPVVQSIVAEVQALLMNHSELDPRQHRLAYVDSFDEYSVKVWVSCYTKSVFLYDFRRVQQGILLKCHEIIRSKGAKLATINTRDVRPGGDTDRYGPFGSAATFGPVQKGAVMTEKPSKFSHVNSDVPGVAYPNSEPKVNLHTIESGIDLSQFSHQQTTSNNSSSMDDSDDEADPYSIPSDRTEAEQRELSQAAVAATAAAFLAARRNAMRIENSEKATLEKTGANVTDGADSAATSPPTDAVGGSSVSSGQMKISAAPPRVPPGSSNAGAAFAGAGSPAGAGGENKGPDENASTPPPPGAVQQVGGGGGGASKSGSSPQGNSGANVGVMKISKGRKPTPVTPLVENSEASVGSAVTQSGRTPSSVSAEDVTDTERHSVDESVGNIRSSVTPGENVAASATNMGSSANVSPNDGMMKIRKARPAMNVGGGGSGDGDGMVSGSSPQVSGSGATPSQPGSVDESNES